MKAQRPVEQKNRARALAAVMKELADRTQKPLLRLNEVREVLGATERNFRSGDGMNGHGNGVIPIRIWLGITQRRRKGHVFVPSGGDELGK